MNDSDLSPGQVTEITAYVDIEARPPPAPTALLIFDDDAAPPRRHGWPQLPTPAGWPL